MMDRAMNRRARNKMSEKDSFSKGILDVIESDYTDRYVMILKDFNRIKTLFTKEEWIDILTKSRSLHEKDIKGLKKQKWI